MRLPGFIRSDVLLEIKYAVFQVGCSFIRVVTCIRVGHGGKPNALLGRVGLGAVHQPHRLLLVFFWMGIVTGFMIGPFDLPCIC